jgi:hypothetical protein
MRIRFLGIETDAKNNGLNGQRINRPDFQRKSGFLTVMEGSNATVPWMVKNGDSNILKNLRQE